MTRRSVNLRVYNTAGRLVRVLEEGERAPGRYSTRWNGRDVTGRSVANGVYFYRLDVPGYRDVKKAAVCLAASQRLACAAGQVSRLDKRRRAAILVM